VGEGFDESSGAGGLAIRLGQEDAALVAAIAYSGQRCPEEILATEWRHVRERTLLVEQRNLDGELTAGQKVKGAAARS
jgi:hypothetical protein